MRRGKRDDGEEGYYPARKTSATCESAAREDARIKTPFSPGRFGGGWSSPKKSSFTHL